MNDEVKFHLPGKPLPLVFRFRDGSSPAALDLIDRVKGDLSTWKFDPKAGKEEQVRIGREFGKVLFPDEETTQRHMRVILSGPHQDINWHLDASWPRLVSIAADWLTRAIGDLARAQREEDTRRGRISDRLADLRDNSSDDNEN